MNKKNIRTLGLLATTLALSLASCDKDDDDTAKLNHSDPRVRTMSIKGINSTFIVNDVEKIIYNYDSLSFGTDISALHPTFNGYQVTTPVFYDSAGVWKRYPKDTTFKLDFSKKPTIRSLSYDSTRFIDYQIDIRVHKFDVESFKWEESGETKSPDSTKNAKAVFSNGKYHYFCEGPQGSWHWISADGEQWESAKAPSSDQQPDWSTLTAFSGKMYVAAGDEILELTEEGALSPSHLQAPPEFDAVKPLFVLGEKLWALSKNSESIGLCYAQTGDTVFTLSRLIDEPISFDRFTASLSSSGNSTLGYLLSPDESGKSIILCIDKLGAVVRPSKGSTFDYCDGMTVFNHENLLCAMGGKKVNGTYSDKTFSSTDSGLTWTENQHRRLPGDGKFCHATIFADKASNGILLIGGNAGKGTPIAWKGVLKQFIMDEMLYGKN